jgi:hypothetical protein
VLEVCQRIVNWRKERRKRRKNKNSGTEMNSCSSNYGIDVLDLQGLEGSKMGNKNAINTSCLCSSDYEVAVSEGKEKKKLFSL